MRPLLDMDTIQIEVTSACVHECSNCTRLVGHSKPFMMTMDEFVNAVDSLIDYPKMVGMMGGEPLIHPLFEEMCSYLRTRIPRERCGLWSTLPKGRERLAPVVAETFGSVLLNDHSHGDLYHGPILVSPEDLGMDSFTMWYRVHHCWIQNSWSASITPRGAFFCEVSAALDYLFQGPGGWPVEPGWWKRTPKDFTEQMESSCTRCGAPYQLRARRDTDGIDDISYSNLQRLAELRSPKVGRGRFAVYTEGVTGEEFHLNSFRREFDYFQKIAARYGLGLRPNTIGYLEPFLTREANKMLPEEVSQ